MDTGDTKAVIIGSGRSGSQYISKLLSDCGIHCTHEKLFRLGVNPDQGGVVESSWFAMPKIEQHGFDGEIFHQIRDPLKVLSSLMNHELFKKKVQKIRLFRENNFYEPAPDWRKRKDWEGWMVRHLTDWLERCDAIADQTWRVEDVSPELIVDIGRALGVDVEHQRAVHCIDSLSKETHKHPGVAYYSWQDLEHIEGVQDLMKIAEQYNYV